MNPRRTGDKLARVVGIIVSVLTISAVDRRFERWLGQTKNYKTGSCCFSARHTTLRSKSKDWLAQNKNNLSDYGDMSTCGEMFLQ